MQNNKAIKIIMLILVLFTFLPTSLAHALTYKQNEIVGLDRSIIKDDSTYGVPKEIIVIPIKATSQINNTVSNDDWFKGVFFYTIKKLGYTDIPFHYVVNNRGEVYEGNKGGDERKINLIGFADDAILVAYLDKDGLNGFDQRALSGLQATLLEICNKNAIPPRNITMTGVTFMKDRESKLVTMEPEDVFGNWSTGIQSVVAAIEPNYSPEAKTYKVKIQAVTLPEGEIEPGVEKTVVVKLQNVGSRGIYPNSDSSLYLTRKGGASSNFYLNTIWASQSQSPVMKDEQFLLPGKEESFEFKIKTPLVVGGYSEIFELRTSIGNLIEADSFEVRVDVKKTDRQIIEIGRTELGYVNVRSDPSTSATIITQASTGERFFLIEVNTETQWAKIDLGDGRTGWIAARYMNYI
jgi:hypothetical protein